MVKIWGRPRKLYPAIAQQTHDPNALRSTRPVRQPQPEAQALGLQPTTCAWQQGTKTSTSPIVHANAFRASGCPRPSQQSSTAARRHTPATSGASELATCRGSLGHVPAQGPCASPRSARAPPMPPAPACCATTFSNAPHDALSPQSSAAPPSFASSAAQPPQGASPPAENASLRKASSPLHFVSKVFLNRLRETRVSRDIKGGHLQGAARLPGVVGNFTWIDMWSPRTVRSLSRHIAARLGRASHAQMPSQCDSSRRSGRL